MSASVTAPTVLDRTDFATTVAPAEPSGVGAKPLMNVAQWTCARCGDTHSGKFAPRWVRALDQPLPGTQVAVCPKRCRDTEKVRIVQRGDALGCPINDDLAAAVL